MASPNTPKHSQQGGGGNGINNMNHNINNSSSSSSFSSSNQQPPTKGKSIKNLLLPSKSSPKMSLGPPSGVSGSLTAAVLRAENLLPPGSGAIHSDPYCVLKIISLTSKSKGVKTGVRKRTLSPHWSELLTLEVQNGESLEIVVKDWRTGLKHKTMGVGSVDLHSLVDGKEKDVVVDLSPQGRVYLKLSFTDESPLFGLPLEDVCLREGRLIPAILTRCIEEIESRGLSDVGLYRVPGNHHTVKQLRAAFDDDVFSVKLTSDVVPVVNALTTIVKLFLRELPAPLFTSSLCAFYVDASSTYTEDHEWIILFRNSFSELPKPNYYAIHYLFDHLLHVLAHEENLMTAASLATCFGPTLLTPADTDENYAKISEKPMLLNAVVQFLLEHWDECRDPLSLVPLSNSSSRRGSEQLDVSGNPVSVVVIAPNEMNESQNKDLKDPLSTKNQDSKGPGMDDDLSLLCTPEKSSNNSNSSTFPLESPSPDFSLSRARFTSTKLDGTSFNVMSQPPVPHDPKTPAKVPSIRVQATPKSSSMHRGLPVPPMTPGTLPLGRVLFQEIGKSEDDSLNLEEFKKLCARAGIDPSATHVDVKDGISYEAFSRLIETRQREDAAEQGRLRSASISTTMIRKERKTNIQKATFGLLLEDLKSQKKERITAEDFQEVCYTMGIFVHDLKKFREIGSFNGSSITYTDFRDWYELKCARMLHDAYATQDKQTSFHQAITCFRAYDRENTGVIDTASFNVLYTDLVSLGYTNLPEQGPKACLAQLRIFPSFWVEGGAPLTVKPDECVFFNQYVKWLLTIRALDLSMQEDDDAPESTIVSK